MTKGGSLSPLPLAHSAVAVALPRESQRLPFVLHLYYSIVTCINRDDPFYLSQKLIWKASLGVLSVDGNFERSISKIAVMDNQSTRITI